MRNIRAGTLTLEPQTAAHAASMFAVLNDPSLYAFIDDAPPVSVESLRTRFEKLESRCSPDRRERWLNWVIRAAAGQLIGYVQATVRESGTAEIAFVLARAHWGRGFAEQAVQAMMGELVKRFGVTALFATASRENLRSIRLLQRLGFVLTAPAQCSDRKVAADDVLLCADVTQIRGGASLR